jgi:hypothetical protein
MEMEALCLSYEGRYSDSDRMFHEVIAIAGRANEPAAVDKARYNFATAQAARGNLTRRLPAWTGL